MIWEEPVEWEDEEDEKSLPDRKWWSDAEGK